jgi:peptidoglycan/xylan/chitin deacetylase (PgdA/CDA1 family)
MSGTSSKPRRAAFIGLLAGGLLTGSLVAVLPAQGAARNLESNPSAESISHGVPTGWAKGGSGKNNRAWSVRSGGAQSGKRYVRTTITRYSSGGAWWAVPSVSARAGTYSFTDYYRSNVRTQLDVAITAKGRTVVKHLATRSAASRWTASKVTVSAPSGTTRLSFRHVLPSSGFLDVDSVGVAPSRGRTAGGSTAPTPAGKGLVSVTFDDGYSNQYDNAFPALKKDAVPGTFFLISGYLDNPSYMTTAQAKELQTAGSEIGAHTVDHPDLTTLSGSALTSELADSKASLEKKFGVGKVTDMAYPYGASNAAVQAEAAKYYSSARSTDSGSNARGALKKYALTIGYVLNTTSVDTIKGWIADAKAKDTWLILCYHGVADNKPTDTYTTSVPNFTAAMDAIKSAGLKPVTVHDGLAAMGG